MLLLACTMQAHPGTSTLAYLCLQGKTDPYSVALYILRFLLANNAKGEKKGPFYGDVSLGNVPGAQSDETDLAEASSMCLDLHWMVGAGPGCRSLLLTDEGKTLLLYPLRV